MNRIQHRSTEDGKFDIKQGDSTGLELQKEHYDLQFGYFKHFKNGKIYKVDDFVWDGETDRWMILYHGLHDVDMKYVRSVANFLEEVRPLYQAKSVPRFERVETPESERD